MTPAVELNDLTVAYGAVPVLWDIDLAIPAGSLTAIVGPNGAGKSTLIKAVLGLLKPAAGTVRVFGKPFAVQRKRIAYVPQRGSVDWDFPVTVLDVVLMGTYAKLGWVRRPGPVEKAAAAAALDQVGLSDFRDRQIGELSGGQQQRTFLARALVQAADVMILDEPFQGVDATTEAAIVKVLRGLRDTGRTVIAVHHDLSTVPVYFDFVALLNREIIAAGPVADAFTPATVAEAYGRMPLPESAS